MSGSELNASYWNARYAQGDAAWDTGSITIPLREYFDKLSDTDLAILIPGAGNCYEGEYLLEKGFTDVTVLDYAPEALAGFRARVKNHSAAKLVCADFFLHEGKYDLIIEQTFALDPSLRTAYAKKMFELLKPGGKLVGVLFTQTPNAEGPPYPGTEDEYRKVFADFEIKKLEPCYNSIKPRAGRELFLTLLRK
jgi:methyl halide transferase